MAERSTEPAPSDAWQPQPFAERKSQHVTFGDFLNRALLKLLVGGACGAAIGWGLDRMTRMHQRGIEPFKWIGGLVGGMVGGYMNWRRNEAPLLQFDQVYRDYRELPGLLPKNEELVQDNALLKRMLEHQQKSDLPASRITSHDRMNEGTLHPAPHKDMAV